MADPVQICNEILSKSDYYDVLGVEKDAGEE
jgi:curved DNA-binding protein CbpA